MPAPIAITLLSRTANSQSKTHQRVCLCQRTAEWKTRKPNKMYSEWAFEVLLIFSAI